VRFPSHKFSPRDRQNLAIGLGQTDTLIPGGLPVDTGDASEIQLECLHSEYSNEQWSKPLVEYYIYIYVNMYIYIRMYTY
jgi:hypothetical protein